MWRPHFFSPPLFALSKLCIGARIVLRKLHMTGALCGRNIIVPLPVKTIPYAKQITFRSIIHVITSLTLITCFRIIRFQNELRPLWINFALKVMGMFQ